MKNSKQRIVSSKQKRTLGVLMLFTIYCLLFTRVALAHTFATDGTITVLLHTNPDDDPIAGQSAAVLLQISDSKGKFNSANCDCRLTIGQGNQTLFAGALLHVVGDSVYGYTEPFTFPEKGVYQLTVTGKPKTPGIFQNFQVEYDLRVDRGIGPDVATKNKGSVAFLVMSLLLVFAMIVGVGIYFIRKRSR